MIRTGACILELRGVSHARSAAGGSAGPSLHEVSLALAAGSFTVVRGEPGAGGEALLRLLGLFETPAEGALLLEGRETQGWSEEERAEVRGRRLGLLFAAPFLLPSLTVAENIAMPLFRLCGAEPELAARRAEELLAFAGLTELAAADAGDLPVEEQYAAAIARALVHQPAGLLVEGLDAALEGEALRRVTGLLRRAAGERGVAVLATASPEFAPEGAHRIVELVAGRVAADSSFPVVGTP